MRTALLFICLAAMAVPVTAHHPNRETGPVIPRVDFLPPLGNRLPPEYRRVYNRPTYLGGKIAYLIAPSSQEAMAWHRAEHRGDYECNRGRVVNQYFYAKPYEALRIGGRRSVKADPNEQAAPELTGLSAEYDDQYEEGQSPDSDDELSEALEDAGEK